MFHSKGFIFYFSSASEGTSSAVLPVEVPFFLGMPLAECLLLPDLLLAEVFVLLEEVLLGGGGRPD